MAFGKMKRRQPEEQQPMQDGSIEIPEDEMMNPLSIPQQPVQQQYPQQPVQQQQPVQRQQFQSPLSTQQHTQFIPQQPVPGIAKIIEGQLLENGLIRYTLIANKSLGNVGDELPID